MVSAGEAGMKCYKMHTVGDKPEHARLVRGLNADREAYLEAAVTIYRGYAVCGEHLEELRGEEPRKWEDFAEIYAREDWPGVNNLGPPTVIE